MHMLSEEWAKICISLLFQIYCYVFEKSVGERRRKIFHSLSCTPNGHDRARPGWTQTCFNLPCGFHRSKYLHHFLLLSQACVQGGGWEVEQLKLNLNWCHMWRWHHGQWLNLLWHSAGPESVFYSSFLVVLVSVLKMWGWECKGDIV